MAISPEGIVDVAEPQDSDLWHGQLSHMSQVRLDQLIVTNYIRKLQSKVDFCEHCRYGKQT